MVEVVPEDIVDEILVRLPVKSIIRFESVCKGWQSKSHSTSFAEFYEQQSNKREKKSSEAKLLVHTIKLKYLYDVASPLWNGETPVSENLLNKIDGAALHKYQALVWRYRKVSRRKISAIGPLNNGIYCLTSLRRNFLTCGEDVSTCRIALCNPSIRHFKFLPPFPPEFGPQLARLSSYDHCFFFSGFSLDYSVCVVINYAQFKNCNRNCFLVFVYTSEKGWERIVDYIPGVKIEGPSNATLAFRGTPKIMNILDPIEVCSQSFLHGCWHWMTVVDTFFTVLSFNFAHQSFKVINLPPALDNHDILVMVEVIVLHDHLALIYSRKRCTQFFGLQVWMMMDYGVEESWTRIYNVHTDCDIPSPISINSLYGIDYSVVQADAGDESESSAIDIKRLYFTGCVNGRKVIFFDGQGGFEVSSNLCHNFETDVSFNTRGISTYRESLERIM